MEERKKNRVKNGKLNMGGIVVRSIQIGVLLLSALVLLTGCFQIHQEIDLAAGGPTAIVSTRLEVDKAFAGAEMDLFLDSLELSVPGLSTQADRNRFEITEDYTTRVVYVWEGKTPVEGDFALTKRADGSYEFRYPLRRVENLSDQTENSSEIMVISVRLPLPVDVANTMDAAGNVATWALTKRDLQRGVELRAITHAE